jgi:hypothetical protein
MVGEPIQQVEEGLATIIQAFLVTHTALENLLVLVQWARLRTHTKTPKQL